jgi:hypothetical protein
MSSYIIAAERMYIGFNQFVKTARNATNPVAILSFAHKTALLTKPTNQLQADAKYFLY